MVVDKGINPVVDKRSTKYQMGGFCDHRSPSLQSLVWIGIPAADAAVCGVWAAGFAYLSGLEFPIGVQMNPDEYHMRQCGRSEYQVDGDHRSLLIRPPSFIPADLPPIDLNN